MRINRRDIAGRLTTGGYILHAGLDKWKGTEATAQGVHGMASGAYPFLAAMEPKKFLKLLAAGEIATGAALLTPIVSNRLAGLALTGFAGGLLGMYLRTPALHKERSIWPTQAGIGVSKDVWILGIGLDLIADGSATPWCCSGNAVAPTTLLAG